MIQYIKIFQNLGGQIHWYVDAKPRYDDPGKLVTIGPGEYLQAGDPRLTDDLHRSITEVDQMPLVDEIQTLVHLIRATDELREFIKRGHFKPKWVTQTCDSLRMLAAERFRCNVEWNIDFNLASQDEIRRWTHHDSGTANLLSSKRM